MDIEDLPCPQCGSTLTLSKLRIKRERVKRRLEEERRKRYPEPPTHVTSVLGSGKTFIVPEQISGFGSGHISLTPDDGHSNQSLTIAAINSYDDGTGTISINDAILDVCMECGTFYASNAARLREELETEIAEMDPLGALGEIRNTEVGTEG